MNRALYGMMARFACPDDAVEAIHALRRHGLQQIEAYSPYHVEALVQALGFERSKVPLFTLLGGIAGGAGGFFMQWYSAVVSFPLNIGGRPLNSWPLFIPVTFELTILGAAIAAVIAMLAGNRLPCLTHPVFDAPGFEAGTRDRFFVCVRASDALFDREGTARLLQDLSPEAVVEVPA